MSIIDSQFSETTPEFPAPVPPHRSFQALLGYLILLFVIPVGFVVGGQAASFAQVGLVYIPFMVLASLAYLGENSLPAKMLALVWLGFLVLAMALVVFGLIAAAGGGIPLNTPPGTVPALEPGAIAGIGQIGLGVMFSLVFSALGFLSPVRRGLARFLPIDPDSFVHTAALVAVVALTLMGFLPVLINGEPPLLAATFIDVLDDVEMSDTDGLLSQTYTLLWAIPVTIFAVGYGLRRNLGDSLKRLGLVRPTFRQILIGLGVAVLMVVGVNVLEFGLDWLWTTMGWPRTDEAAFGELIAFAFSPLGAVVIGVTAGLGEELAVRGVLQPRLGILLSNLFFASLHAFQYNWDALFVVFLLGMLFGVLRRYTNTSTSAIAHGVYDFILVMMAVYGIELFG